MITDWKEIGIKLGTFTKEDTFDKGSSTHQAKLALELILGEEWIRHSVDMALTIEPGAELAMQCLKQLSSEYAVEYAYSIYKSDSDEEKKRQAVWLIKHLAVPKSFQWVDEFLNDKNVMGWGIGVLDQLLWCHEIDYEDNKEHIDSLFKLAIKNSDGHLKDNVDFIKDYLHGREEDLE